MKDATLSETSSTPTTARVFVEKKPAYATEAASLKNELNELFGLHLNSVRLINTYDLFNTTPQELATAKNSVLAETVTDTAFDSIDLTGLDYVSWEYLPGQYDQRADSAMQCLALLTGNEDVTVKSGKLAILTATNQLSEPQRNAIKAFLINPVEAREMDLAQTPQLEAASVAAPVATETGFTTLSGAGLAEFLQAHELAMSLADLELIQDYFRNVEHRDPTATEIKVLDTYWSDHCRHTTFETHLNNLTIKPGRFHDAIQAAFDEYLAMRIRLGRDSKPLTLMDMATIAAKDQRAAGLLDDMEVSDEINACSIRINVDVDGIKEPWLLMFKNETHNHPTEIEPFGGASTCIGGAIRDPLSGRSFVYQALRLSGVGDVTEPIAQTLAGKLPQRVIAKGSAHGNSSYGNQIGLPTSFVREIFDEGYKAKHLETGAVVGAARASDVIREKPIAGDAIILLGGGTGRDGIGGATGSSKVHTTESVTSSSAEVQKGNAPMERRIQRLFRNPQVTHLIKKCNDFGAGGVCVAIGELAPGIDIDLAAVPVKYQGLDGTELAVSESQERMAVVVSQADVPKFIELAAQENLHAVQVATVTDSNRLKMEWNGSTIVDISRDFLDTNGATQTANAQLVTELPGNPLHRKITGANGETSFAAQFLANLALPNIASRQGMVEMFDSTVGASTVLMPYGGEYQLTESEGSVHKLPVTHGETETVSIMTCGFMPEIAKWSPFHGAVYAVVESVARVVALGAPYQGIRFSFQEYFPRLGTDPVKWGLPVSALLGAIHAQAAFGLPAIGGKDSMSGTFHELEVPPTLISFAVQTANAGQIISPEFKQAGNYVYLISTPPLADLLPNTEQLKSNYDYLHQLMADGSVISASTVKSGGIAEAIAKMSFGNRIGIDVETDLDPFEMRIGGIVVESTVPLTQAQTVLLGRTTAQPTINFNGSAIAITDAVAAWQGKYDSVYPRLRQPESTPVAPTDIPLFAARLTSAPAAPLALVDSTTAPTAAATLAQAAQPQVYLPVFPGTNCEYESARAFERLGAKSVIDVFRNLTPADTAASIERMANYLDKSQILMISGGFSAGDEPDGSGKFITAVLMNPQIRQSVENLLARDGLILGICNGFQALIKSGLLPYGEFGKVTPDSPTLVRNLINRHVSRIVQTRITSNLSPWLANTNVGEVYSVPISSGEGRFVANAEVIGELAAHGQIATQYVDPNGIPTMAGHFNPNGSFAAIEGITSPDGRIFGKMAHSERSGRDLLKNVPGHYDQQIFQAGVNYFS